MISPDECSNKLYLSQGRPCPSGNEMHVFKACFESKKVFHETFEECYGECYCMMLFENVMRLSREKPLLEMAASFVSPM